MGPVVRLFYVDGSRDRGKTGHHYFVGLLADGHAVARAEASLESIAEQAYDSRREAAMERLSRIVYDAVPAPQGQFHTIR